MESSKIPSMKSLVMLKSRKLCNAHGFLHFVVASTVVVAVWANTISRHEACVQNRDLSFYTFVLLLSVVSGGSVAQLLIFFLSSGWGYVAVVSLLEDFP